MLYLIQNKKWKRETKHKKQNVWFLPENYLFFITFPGKLYCNVDSRQPFSIYIEIWPHHTSQQASSCLEMKIYFLLNHLAYQQHSNSNFRNKKEECVQLMCKRLKKLDIHPALCLLRSCMSSPKFIYLLQTCPSFLHPNNLSQIYELFRSSSKNICNTRITDAK